MYRLEKAGLSEQEDRRFLVKGPLLSDYQAVLFLLAVDTGLPDMRHTVYKFHCLVAYSNLDVSIAIGRIYMPGVDEVIRTSNSINDIDDEDKADVASAIVQDASDDKKVDVASAAVEAVPDEAKAGVASAAVRALPDAERDTLLNTLLPSQPAMNQVWLIIVSAFAIVFVLAAVSLFWAAITVSDAASVQTLLTVVTTVAGLLAGFISGRASAGGGTGTST